MAPATDDFHAIPHTAFTIDHCEAASGKLSLNYGLLIAASALTRSGSSMLTTTTSATVGDEDVAFAPTPDSFQDVPNVQPQFAHAQAFDAHYRAPCAVLVQMAAISCSDYNTRAPKMFPILLSEVSHLLRFIVLVQPKSLIYPEAGRSRLEYHDCLRCTSLAILPVDFLHKKVRELTQSPRDHKGFFLGVFARAIWARGVRVRKDEPELGKNQ